MSGDPTLPEGFPDLFVFTLRDILQTELSADPDFPATTFLTRSARPTDPTRTISVIEDDAVPAAYEIARMVDPSIMTWNVLVKAFVKHSNEIEGRNIRARLLRRIRKALFLPSTVQSLMILNDDVERMAKFELRRINWASAEARDANKQFFLLGQIELQFQTERK